MSDIQKEIDHFFDEVEYFNEVKNDEVKKFLRDINGAALRSNDIFQVFRNLSDEMAEVIGELRARIQFLESECAQLRAAASIELQPYDVGAAHVSGALRDTITVDADEIFAGANFYGVEYANETVPYRWTGPGRRVSLRLPLDRSKDLAGFIVLLSAIDKAVLNNARIYVDGERAQFQLTTGKGYQIRFVIPKKDAVETTTLTLVTGQTMSPSERDQGDDPRQLGVAFVRCQVRPLHADKK